jgi:RNA polymerase sigma-70 factor (ECF subfamily)
MSETHILKDLNQFSDLEVIRQVLSGNTVLFELLIRRNNSFLYKTGRAYGYNHQDTEDLMQETYITAYQHLAGFENRSSLKTWIIRIMLNLCFHKAHKQSFQKEKTVGEFTANQSARMSLAHNHSDTMQSVIKQELSHIIEASLDKLPKDYRMTFTLRELAGLNVAETAEAMKVTESNVKVRLNRAKMMLRKEIEKIYSSEDIYEFNLIYCDRIVAEVMKRISS